MNPLIAFVCGFFGLIFLILLLYRRLRKSEISDAENHNNEISAEQGLANNPKIHDSYHRRKTLKSLKKLPLIFRHEKNQRIFVQKLPESTCDSAITGKAMLMICYFRY